MSEEITKKVAELEARIVKLELVVNTGSPLSVPVSTKRADVSVVEFLREKKPVTSVDKTLVFAVYHENHTDKDSFNTEDLLSLWRQAKEASPANINDLINKNIKKGFVAEEKVEKGQKKSWYVTTSGIDAVKKTFQK